MSQLKLYLFGAPRIQIDDVPIALPRRKVTAILIYLAVTQQIQRRDTLATLLWPESDQKVARSSLRREFSVLCNAIGNEWFAVNREEIALARNVDIWVDTVAFQQAVVETATHGHPPADVCNKCLPVLTRAVSLYTGEFLTGFTLSGCPEFDDWQSFQTDSLRRTMAQALEKLVQLHEVRGEYDPAIDYAHSWLALDPMHEPTHRKLMHLYALAGSQAAAIRRYDECVRILKEELGVPPEEETTQLYQAILTRRYPDNFTKSQAPQSQAPQSQTIGLADDQHPRLDITQEEFVDVNVDQLVSQIPPSEPALLIPHIDWGEAPDIGPFYGREVELTQLAKWLLLDRCRLVAVLGMGGIGKTSLIAKLIQRLAEPHPPQVAQTQGGHTPIHASTIEAPFAHARFQRIIWRSLLNAPPLIDILPQWLQFLSDQRVTEQPSYIDQWLTLLLTYLRQDRCLIILDNVESILQGDSQQAGQYRPGYEEYGQLIRRLSESEHQSCLLLTSRESPNDFRRLAGDTNLVRSLTLTGLSTAVSQQFLADRGLSDSEALIQTLVERYSGNPLALKLVSDTVQDLFAGDLEQFLTAETLIFDDIRAVLDQQFARMSPLEREIMIWLMLEREAISAERILTHLAQPPPRRVFLEALRSLERRSLLVKSNADRGVNFTLQNVVTEYTTDHFIEQICRELETETLSDFARHPLLKAQAKDYIRESQSRLILEPIAKQLLAREGIASFDARLRRLLAALQRKSPLTPSYAAGNILNLLLYLKSDLRGLDFSHLRVWQACLEGAQLPETNFAQADLAGSVFTDIFGAITSVAFSPDGEVVAAGTNEGQIHLWQVMDGQPLFTYEGHTDWVLAVAFSPTEQILASGSADHTIRLWDIRTGQCLRTLTGHTDWILSVAFSADGQTLASSGHDSTIRLWNVQRGQCLQTLADHTDWIRAVAFSPTDPILASGSVDQTVRLWDARSGRCLKTLAGHSGEIRSVAFSRDGQTLASGSVDQTIRLWDVQRGRCLKTLSGHTNWIRSVAFGPDGQTLASGGFDQTVRIWDVQSGKILKLFSGHTNAVWSVAFSPKEAIVASGSADKTVRLWDVQSGRCLRRLSGYTNWIRSLAFSPNGRTLVSGSADQLVHVWDMATSEASAASRHVKSLSGHSDLIESVAFSADALTIASGSADKTVRLWNVQNSQCLRTLTDKTARIKAVAFSPNGRIVASGSDDQTVRLWDVVSGQCLHTLTGHTNWVWSIAFSPDGQIIASGSDDQTVRLWDVVSGQCLHVLAGHTNWVWSVAFSPDGQVVASGSQDHTIRLWDVMTGHCLRTLAGHTNCVWALAFSPDGRTLASGSIDQTIRLWDRETGNCLKTLSGHSNSISSVAFHPDGQILASSSADETIKLWDVQAGVCIETLGIERPYERMNITGVTGISRAQKETLKSLGAVEQSY